MNYKKYSELERLVSTGGDSNKIESLRRELGIKVYERPTPKADMFNIGEYKKYKRRNVPDRIIAEELGMSIGTLRRLKKQNGLTAVRKDEA